MVKIAAPFDVVHCSYCPKNGLNGGPEPKKRSCFFWVNLASRKYKWMVLL